MYQFAFVLHSPEQQVSMGGDTHSDKKGEKTNATRTHTTETRRLPDVGITRRNKMLKMGSITPAEHQSMSSIIAYISVRVSTTSQSYGLLSHCYAAFTPKAKQIFAWHYSPNYSWLFVAREEEWLISMETVIISTIHHRRKKHYFCFCMCCGSPTNDNVHIFFSYSDHKFIYLCYSKRGKSVHSRMLSPRGISASTRCFFMALRHF